MSLSTFFGKLIGIQGPSAAIAEVKALGVAAGATDAALVVTISPNSTGGGGGGGGGTVTQGTAAALAGAWPVEITDGTNILGVSAHPVRTDPTGTTTQPVSGTVTANVGTAGGLALDATLTGGTAKARLTDGTNTAAVKAASTAAVATDPAIVTALSPNSPLPAGANAIGTVGVTSLPAIPAGANAIGSVTVTGTTNTSNVALDATNNVEAVAWKPVSSAAYAPSFSNNAAVVSGAIKAAAGNLFSVQATNRAASAVYFQLFNLTTAPTNGAAAFGQFLVPAGGEIIVGQDFFTTSGIRFSTGISFGFSTTSGTYTAATAANCDSMAVYI